MWSHDAARLVSACWDQSLNARSAQVWNVASGLPLAPPLDHRDGVRQAAFSADGNRILTCGEDFEAVVWDARNGQPTAPPMRHEDAVFCGAFSADGLWVATGSRSKTVRVWDARGAEPLLPPFRVPSELVEVRFSPQAQCLLARTQDGTL